MKRPVILAALCLLAADALACKCTHQTLAEVYEQAPIVFVGVLRQGQEISDHRPSGTVTYEVTQAFKGEVRVGLSFTVDPLFRTDCTAPLLPGASVLVFAYPGDSGAPKTSACGSKLAAPFLFEGKELQPAPEVTELLLSLGQ